jgi:heme O synthase-like polyprenyltransferase
MCGETCTGKREPFMRKRLKATPAFRSEAEEKVAMQTFGYSIWYLMAIFALLLVDHYLPELY